MQITPYLNFDGQCREAFERYQQILGGTIEAMTTHGETPAAEFVLPEHQNSIMHARLVTATGQVLMASDAPPGRYSKPQGMYVSLHVDDPAEADRIFNALAEGGTVQMPIQETFWAARFGMLADRFGILWMINCDKAD